MRRRRPGRSAAAVTLASPIPSQYSRPKTTKKAIPAVGAFNPTEQPGGGLPWLRDTQRRGRAHSQPPSSPSSALRRPPYSHFTRHRGPARELQASHSANSMPTARRWARRPGAKHAGTVSNSWVGRKARSGIPARPASSGHPSSLQAFLPGRSMLGSDVTSPCRCFLIVDKYPAANALPTSGLSVSNDFP